jgi:coenzyme F420 hydrogenase subunit beta
VDELLQTKGIRLGDIQDFQFRGGSWPGKMRAVMHDREIRNLHHSNYKDGAYNYFIGMYMAKRCQTCIDGSCEFSDLSISDVWTRDRNGDYKFTAHSRVLCRTALGVAVTTRAAQRGTLNIHDVTGDSDHQTHRMQTRRKGLNAPLRVARWARNGVPVPLYDRPTPEATVKERWTEYAVSSCLWASQFHAIRYPLIKFLTSRYAKPLIQLRMWRKKRKYQRSAIGRLPPN